MASVFTLFGELKADTSSFTNSLRQAEDRLRATEGAIAKTEQRSRGLGNTTAVGSRQFEKYNERLNQQRNILTGATGAFQRGEISARRYHTIIGQTEKATANLNSRLKDHGARLTDLAQKQSLLSRISGGLSGIGGFLGVGITAGGALGLAGAAINKAIEQAKAYRLLSASATEAGLSQSVLFEKNKQFAGQVGLSEVASAGTVSSISRLNAYAGGGTAQLDKLLSGFADLGAARGINGNDLQTLIGSILSGQDEGLNRLGISDPGQLYKQFAKEHGKSVESLTQQEKVQAAVNAVLEKSAMFAGAADLRMASLEGTVAKTTAAWENFTNALSTNFATSGPVSDFLRTASELVQGLSIDLDQVNKRLAEGKSAKQIANELYAGPGAGDYVSAAASNVAFGIGGYGIFGLLARATVGSDAVSGAVSPSAIAERRKADFEAQIAAQAEVNKNQGLAAAQTRSDKSISTYTAWQKEQIDKTFGPKAMEAAQKAREAALTQGLSREQSAMRSNFSVQEAILTNHLAKKQASEIQSLQATSRLKNAQLQAQIQTDRSYYNALIANAATPEDKARFTADRDSNIKAAQNEILANNINTQTQIIEKTRELKKEIASIFVGLAGENNPFVKIFDDGRLAIERIREATRGLGPDLQKTLEQMQRSATAAAYFGQGLDNALHASNLRNEARQFRAGSFDADTPENFQDNLQRQLTALGASPYRSFSDAAKQSTLDQRIIALTSGLDPAKLTAYQQDIAADAREREALRLEKQAGEEQQLRKKLAMVLEHLDSSLNGGHLITIRNEAGDSARVERKPSRADAAQYYGT
jgi:hypothetical protein